MNDKDFTDETLGVAYRLLFGENWQRGLHVKGMAQEMRGIINGGTKPCIAFENWVKCINYLEERLKQKQA